MTDPSVSTTQSLPSTPSELRASIPVTERVAYLNTGATGPCTQPVLDATTEAQRRFEVDDHAEKNPYYVAADAYDETREAVSGLLGGDPDQWALTQSTTDGINRVTTASPLSAGDTVLVTDVEHHSGELPYYRLADTRGIDVHEVPTEQGDLSLDTLADAVETHDPDLVSLSAVEWEFGYRLPVPDVVEIAHDAGARVLVDAVQAVGVWDFDVESWGADFVAGGGHKWLLGPWGSGFLYVAPDATEWLRPEAMGYRTVADANADPSEYELAAGARRLEYATTNPAPYAGLRKAIEIHESVGIDTMQSRVERLTDRLKRGLGDRLHSPEAFHTGLVTFAAEDPTGLVEELESHDVIVRDIPTRGTVRASVHAFNTEDEIDRLLDVVAD